MRRIIGNPETAEMVARRFPSASQLLYADEKGLTQIPGVGHSTARRLVGAVAIANNVLDVAPQSPGIRSPEDAAELLFPRISHLEQEDLWVLLLDTRNTVMDMMMVYRGSVNSSQIRVGELFKAAIRKNASAIIVAHNHPSGDPNPSPDDVAVTRAIVEAGKLLDIEVLDHLVIGKGRFVSLKQRGLFPK